jgi:hypothetical protein
VGTARINLRRHPHGAREGFKCGLNNMVGIDAVELADVQGHLGVVDHSDKEFAHQLGVIGADALSGNLQAVAQVGATREVEGDLHQRFIQGRNEVTEADDAFTIAQCLRQGHPERNPDIFIGVVVVDVDVACGLDVEVKQTMGGDLVQHVIEEGDACVDIALACAIEADRGGDIGFAGFAVDGGAAAGGESMGDGGTLSGLHDSIVDRNGRMPSIISPEGSSWL